MVWLAFFGGVFVGLLLAGHGEAERVVELMEAAMNEGFVDAALYGLIYPYGVTDGTFIVTKIASL